MNRPLRGTLIGLISGLILTVVIVLYMFTAAVTFVLPYIVAFSLLGMVIYGLIREQAFRKPKETKKNAHTKYFPD